MLLQRWSAVVVRGVHIGEVGPGMLLRGQLDARRFEARSMIILCRSSRSVSVCMIVQRVILDPRMRRKCVSVRLWLGGHNCGITIFSEILWRLRCPTSCWCWILR